MKRILRRSWSFPRSQEWLSFWWGGEIFRNWNIPNLQSHALKTKCAADHKHVQIPTSLIKTHFSFSGRLGDSETYFNLGELPFYFTTIWIWENPKKILSPKNVDFFLDMLENPWHQKKTHLFWLFGLDQLRFFLRLKMVQCQGPRNHLDPFSPRFPWKPQKHQLNSEGAPRKSHLNQPTNPPIVSGSSRSFFAGVFHFQTVAAVAWVSVATGWQKNLMIRLETALIEAVGTKTQAPLARLVFDSDGCKTPVAQTGWTFWTQHMGGFWFRWYS